MLFKIKKLKNEKASTRAIVTDDVKSYANDPYILKKADVKGLVCLCNERFI